MIDPSARQWDLALARRILRGETELWPALCRGAETQALYAARAVDVHKLLPPYEYEEIAREALAQCYDQLDRYAGRSRFAYWVRAYARHRALNHCARRRTQLRKQRLLEAAAREHDAFRDPLHILLQRERDRALWAAIGMLEPLDCEILLWRVLEGKPWEALGKKLGLPSREVSSRYGKAIVFVRTQFLRLYGEEPQGL